MDSSQWDKLDGKILAAADGGRLPVTKVQFVTDKRGGEDVFLLEIGCLAGHYLVNPGDPSDGVEALPEAVPASYSHNLEKEDAHQFLTSVNRHLGLSGEDAVVADEDNEWAERFTEGHPRSLLPLLREKGVYFRCKKKQNAEVSTKFGGSPFFFSFHDAPERRDATAEALAAVKAKLAAKKAAKKAAEEAKKAADAAVFG